MKLFRMKYDFSTHIAFLEFYLILVHLLDMPDIVTFLFHCTYFVGTSDTDIVDLWPLSVIDAVFLSVHCLPAVFPSNSCEGLLGISGTSLVSVIYDSRSLTESSDNNAAVCFLV